MILEAIFSFLLSLRSFSSFEKEYQEGQAYNTIDPIDDK